MKVPTLDGQVTVRIPPGTPSGKVLRVRGQGVQADGNGKAAGDLLVTVDVQVPDRARRRAARRGRGARRSVLADDPRAALFAQRRRPEEDRWTLTTRALYVISVAAELAGVHPQTLRIYERKGLIEPARTSGRSRRYSDRDIELLRRIQELTNEGVSASPACNASSRSRTSSRDARAHASPSSKRASTRCARKWKRASKAVHQEYRRELVPLRSATVVRFETRRRRRPEMTQRN